MDETLEVNELDSVDGLFDDFEPTSDEPVENEESETTETVESEPVEQVEETVEDPYALDVKFNGEERTLTKDEARILAQKGMNYDRIYEPLERLARMNNMSVGDYINQLNDTQEQYEVEKEIENLRNDAKYENVSDEVLEELARSRVKDFMGKREEYFAEQTKKETEDQQARVQREVDHFLDEYPEYRDKGPESLDPKVFEFVKQGYTLLEAFNKFQRMNSVKSQAEQKAKVNQLNEENKKKSLGNTSNAGSGDTDSFLEGFLNS